MTWHNKFLAAFSGRTKPSVGYVSACQLSRGIGAVAPHLLRSEPSRSTSRGYVMLESAIDLLYSGRRRFMCSVPP